MKKLKVLLMGMSVFALSSVFSVNAAPLQGNIAIVNALGSVKSVNFNTFCRQYPEECFCFVRDGERVCIPY